jgi:5-methyltetrahydropteroyltriglutamate--homocysteine methyltransferase
VVAATRGSDRGRVGPDVVERAFTDDLGAFIRLQRQAGMDFYSDGLLRWQDIFRPLVDALGIRPHTLVRWFDTNTFFREPEFAGNLPEITNLGPIVPDESVPRPRVMTLPSPFMLSRAARTDRDRNRLMVDLVEQVLRPVADAGVTAGTAMIHLEEPWLAYHGIESQAWEPLREALNILHRDLQATITFHVYFGDAGPFMANLRRLPVDVVGIDLIETDVGALGRDWEKGLLAGVIDGRQSIVESTDNLVEAARHLADTVRPRDLYLSSNCELAFLPTVVAERKVQRLGEAAQKVKELVSV